ncbi:MAG TPA: YggS family pyridoxal phosphate-dependent enzyme [Chitinophagales bacterium]|nr:YggS family pyridoxal phosphate-dependent enzyme [Chitinophagales bacterium]HRK28946.1 YggS family pyridoxal phosphate-dependent enzyme [Chitinophagales bacterium]
MPNLTAYHQILQQLAPCQATLVAVSKNHTAAELLPLYHAGQRIFGENKVQELLSKQPQMPPDVQWHLIGHLQTNKVKYIAPFIALIHSIDSFKLLQTVNKEAGKCNRVINCLLQVHIAQEETKFGFDIAELHQCIAQMQQNPLPHVNLNGLMGMASFTNNTEQVKTEFITLATLFNTIKQTHLNLLPNFTVLSMGMSADYPIALQCGSNMVRIGSLLF